MMEMVLGLLFACVLGLGWGSYATMATYRFPRSEPWGGKKPRCPSCGHELRFRDFAPIWAYTVSRGKCKFCGVKVTPVYLCTEIYCLLAFIACYLAFGFTETFLLVSSIAVFIVIITVTELESRMVPDKAMFLLFFIGCIYRVFVDHSIYGLFYGGVAGMMVGFAVKHLKAAMRKEDYDWHKAFLRVFTSEYIYVRMLIVMGVILPLPVFGIVLLGATPMIFLWETAKRRLQWTLPVPYAGILGAGLLLALLCGA